MARPGWGFIYAGIVNLVFNGGSGANLYQVLGTNFGTITTINCGPNADVVAIGSPFVGLFSMLGPLFVNGGGFNPIPQDTFMVSSGGSSVGRQLSVGDMVVIDDSAVSAATFYSLANGAFQSTGHAPMSVVNNVESFSLKTTTAKDTISMVGSPAAITLINTNGGDSVFVFGTATNSATAINGDARGNTFDVVKFGGLDRPASIDRNAERVVDESQKQILPNVAHRGA